MYAAAVAVIAAVVVTVIVTRSDDDDARPAGSTTTTVKPVKTDPDTTDDSVPTTTDPVGSDPVTTDPITTDPDDPLPPDDEDGTIPGAPAGRRGSQDAPLAIGEIADVGQGYRVQVLSVTPDGTDEVLEAWSYNDPPPDGSRFTLVEIAIGAFTTDDPVSFAAVDIRAVGANRVQLSDDCGSLPDQLDMWRQAFAGSVVRGNICFVTTPADEDELILYATAMFTDESAYLDATTPPADPPNAMMAMRGLHADAASSAGRGTPTPIGTTVELDNDWSATVTGALSDVTEIVEDDIFSSITIGEGERVVMVPVRLDYRGSTPMSAMSVQLSAVGDSNLGYEPYYGNVPDELERYVDIFGGGSLEGNVAFIVPEEDLGSIVFYTSMIFSDITYFATA